MPADPAPIRGRWTITICDGCGQQIITQGHAGRCEPATEREVDVVPVPDEAAIERAAKALYAGSFRPRLSKDVDKWWAVAPEESREFWRAEALAVLRAALETQDAR